MRWSLKWDKVSDWLQTFNVVRDPCPSVDTSKGLISLWQLNHLQEMPNCKHLFIVAPTTNQVFAVIKSVVNMYLFRPVIERPSQVPHDSDNRRARAWHHRELRAGQRDRSSRVRVGEPTQILLAEEGRQLVDTTVHWWALGQKKRRHIFLLVMSLVFCLFSYTPCR